MSNKDVYSMSKELSLKEIEEIYYNTILKQEFYDVSYAKDWVDETPYRAMAQLIIKYFKPKKVLDLGCGLGLTVKHLRRLGVEAYGIDFSEAFIKCADEEYRKYLTNSTIENLPYDSNEFDLVICMEVLEHLPLSITEKVVEEIKRVSKGFYLITTPSFGYDEFRPAGLELNEECWIRSAKQNIPFKNIVLKNGVPDCGHITLATCKWWTEFFSKRGLIRSPKLEELINEDDELKISRFRWNTYAMYDISSGVSFDNKLRNNLGTGWFDSEQWGDNEYVRWTKSYAEFYLKVNNEKDIELVLTAGPPNLVYDSRIDLTLVNLANEREMKESFSVECNQWNKKVISIEQLKVNNSIIKGIIECNKLWSPRRLGLPDNRELGIATKSIELRSN